MHRGGWTYWHVKLGGYVGNTLQPPALMPINFAEINLEEE